MGALAGAFLTALRAPPYRTGNTVGPELFDADWADPAGKQLERKGSIEKLRAIARKAGVEFDLSYEPWNTIVALVQARHTLMHPKPCTDSVNAEVTCREEDLREEADRVAASKWNPLLDLDAATKARDAVYEGLSRLWVGLGHDARALRLHGMRSHRSRWLDRATFVRLRLGWRRAIPARTGKAPDWRTAPRRTVAAVLTTGCVSPRQCSRMTTSDATPERLRAPDPLERAQKRHQISLFLHAQPHGEARVVELDRFLEILGKPVMEVRCAPGQAAQDRALEACHVPPIPGD
jgi:hypothetical protein